MTNLLILAFILGSYQSWYCHIGQAQSKTKVQVPAGFAYPESPSKTELKDPIKAKSLSGTVADPAGFPIPRVLVERVSPDWKKRLDATFTDSEGSFAFAKAVVGKHFLKLSKPGFDTLLVRVTTTKKSKAKLKLHLNVSS